MDLTGKVGHEASEMTEAEFLKAYRKEEYPKPSVAVDLIIFTVLDTDLKVLLIRRKGHPFKGCWAFPGGFVHVGDGYEDQGESLDETAHRELAEETGLPKGSCFLEQLYTFGKPGRDPRTRVISVSYYALVPSDLMPLIKAGDDAAEAQWFSVGDLQRDGVYETSTGERFLVKGSNVPELAFDHATILSTAVERIRGKIDYAPLAFALVPATFTVPELRAVYEAVKGETYDPRNFNRRFRRMLSDGVILPAPGKRPTASRPAAVYSFMKR
jgi:8-oxo-dGTP diphosphatase